MFVNVIISGAKSLIAINVITLVSITENVFLYTSLSNNAWCIVIIGFEPILKNALSPLMVVEFGIRIAVTCVQLLNASSPILVNEIGNIMLVNLEQFSKDFIPMLIKPVSNEILVNPVQL